MAIGSLTRNGRAQPAPDGRATSGRLKGETFLTLPLRKLVG